MIFRIIMKLFKRMVFEKGQRFTIRIASITIGTGVITNYFTDLDQKEKELLYAGRRGIEKLEKKKQKFKA
jgi:hypothetical protein